MRRVECECGRVFYTDEDSVTACLDCATYDGESVVKSFQSSRKKFDKPNERFLPPKPWDPREESEGGLL